MANYNNTVLIAGASGLVGSAALNLFLAQSNWDVIAVSRRPIVTESKNSFVHLNVDLRNTTLCKEAFNNLSHVTHVVYAALSEKSQGLFQGWFDKEQIETNNTMLRNVIDPLLEATKGNMRVVIVHGTKAYGVHLPNQNKPIRVFNENTPRETHSNFYFDQEDYIKRVSLHHPDFKYTFLRPPLIVNATHGAAMSVLAAIGAFAVLLREQNKPLPYPGDHAPKLCQMVDARLLAKMILWSSTTSTAVNKTFNCTNGDFIIWQDLWKSIATMFGMETGQERRSMTAFFVTQEQAWAALAEKHQLEVSDLKEFLSTSGEFTDLLLDPGPTVLCSDNARHQAGFHETADTTAIVLELLKKMIDQKYLPNNVQEPSLV